MKEVTIISSAQDKGNTGNFRREIRVRLVDARNSSFTVVHVDHPFNCSHEVEFNLSRKATKELRDALTTLVGDGHELVRSIHEAAYEDEIARLKEDKRKLSNAVYLAIQKNEMAPMRAVGMAEWCVVAEDLLADTTEDQL